MWLTVFLLCISGYALSPALAENHAIYVSVIEIEQSKDQTDGVIRLKIFANDLEDAIQNHSGNRVDLIDAPCSQSEESIKAYLNDHFKLAINNKEASYTYEQCEINDISIWITLNLISNDQWHKVEVEADYLMELFPTQSNVISLTYSGQKRMGRMTKSTSTISFEL